MNKDLWKNSSRKVFWHSELNTGKVDEPMSGKQHRHCPGQNEEAAPSQERICHQRLRTQEKPWIYLLCGRECSHRQPAPELEKSFKCHKMGENFSRVSYLVGFRESTEVRSLKSAVNVGKASVSTQTSGLTQGRDHTSVGNVGKASATALASLFTRGPTLGRSLTSTLSVGKESTNSHFSTHWQVHIVEGLYQYAQCGKSFKNILTSVPTRKPALGKSYISASSVRKALLRTFPSSAIRIYIEEIHYRKQEM